MERLLYSEIGGFNALKSRDSIQFILSHFLNSLTFLSLRALNFIFLHYSYNNNDDMTTTNIWDQQN